MTDASVLHRAQHRTVKRWVLRALRTTASGSSAQHTLVKKICAMKEVRNLLGQRRKDFEEKVNKAVAALLREKPAKITRSKSGGKYIRLVRKRPKPRAELPANSSGGDVIHLGLKPRLETYVVCPHCGAKTRVNPEAVDFTCEGCRARMPTG